MTFKLDTSGFVYLPSHHGGHAKWSWDGLSPFVQGYVEAMFAEWRTKPWPKCPACDGAGFVMASRLPHTPPDRLECSCPKRPRGYGFRHLAPETLARIIEDCRVWLDRFGPDWPDAEHGVFFWEERQCGRLDDFPPLTVYLGDDGKVVFQ